MKTFSNCSMHDYKHYASELVAKCLSDLSNEQVLQQNQPVCGDGIVEADEECDCGNDTVSFRHSCLTTVVLIQEHKACCHSICWVCVMTSLPYKRYMSMNISELLSHVSLL